MIELFSVTETILAATLSFPFAPADRESPDPLFLRIIPASDPVSAPSAQKVIRMCVKLEKKKNEKHFHNYNNVKHITY